MLICASAICDDRNCNAPLSHMPFYMGLAVIGLGIGFSLNCGVPINPARDLSPRLFSYIVGWGPQVFRYHTILLWNSYIYLVLTLICTQHVNSYDNWMWFWIPLVFPYIGATIGAYIYIIFIQAHWPK